MKKKLIISFFGLLLLAGIFIAYKTAGPATGESTRKYLYIRETETLQDISKQLEESGALKNTAWFRRVAGWMNYTRPRPGRYELKKGMSLYNLVKMLRAGRQAPVKLVIVKERTRELFAGKMGKKFDTDCDSLCLISYLNNNDSLRQFGVDSNTVMSIVMPFTYEIYWNSSPRKIVSQFQTAWDKFWTPERKAKAEKQGLTPLQVSILASIVEEETTRKPDKYNIASVYLNRLRRDMKLEADPTAKFVTRNFGLNRITYAHLRQESPYNTYIHKGLPPGPICTPSVESLEAVLDAPQTDYIFFVASYKFDGSSIFTSNYADHQKYVKLFHAEQNRRADSLKKRKG